MYSVPDDVAEPNFCHRDERTHFCFHQSEFYLIIARRRSHNFRSFFNKYIHSSSNSTIDKRNKDGSTAKQTKGEATEIGDDDYLNKVIDSQKKEIPWFLSQKAMSLAVVICIVGLYLNDSPIELLSFSFFYDYISAWSERPCRAHK